MRIKICGLTNLLDTQAACDLGAWAVGFIFHPASARYVSPHAVREIVARLAHPVTTVGVVVDDSHDRIEQIWDESGVQVIQFHGRETPEFCARFNRPFIKAISDPAQLSGWEAALAILVDAPKPMLVGQTTATASPSLVDEVRRDYPQLILAGGLTPNTVTGAMRRYRPNAVDVASGVEKSPGVKDHAKLAEFFARCSKC